MCKLVKQHNIMLNDECGIQKGGVSCCPICWRSRRTTLDWGTARAEMLITALRLSVNGLCHKKVLNTDWTGMQLSAIVCLILKSAQ